MTTMQMNHCTSGRAMDIGPFWITVMMSTGPRFSFSTNSGCVAVLHALRARQHVLARPQPERAQRVLQAVVVGRRRAARCGARAGPCG